MFVAEYWNRFETITQHCSQYEGIVIEKFITAFQWTGELGVMHTTGVGLRLLHHAGEKNTGKYYSAIVTKCADQSINFKVKVSVASHI